MSPGIQLVTQEYSDREYWNERYSKSSRSCFDWYQRYDTLKYVINPVIPKDAALLQVSIQLTPGPELVCSSTSHSSIFQVGVGNSRLQLDMSLDGYTSILSVDYSDIVIEQMQYSHQQHPRLQYAVADAR